MKKPLPLLFEFSARKIPAHGSGYGGVIFARVWCMLAATLFIGASSPSLSKDHFIDKKSEKATVSPKKGNPWQRVCDDEADLNTCRIVQDLFLKKTIDGVERKLGRLIRIVVLYGRASDTGIRRSHITMELPLGVDLRPGAVIRVDKGSEISLKYLRCSKDGCTVSREIDDVYLRDMKRGQTLNVGFRVWGGKRVTVVKATLRGFSRALKSLH